MTPDLAAIAARNAARTQGKWEAVALGNDDYPSEVWFADNMRVCLMPSNTGQRKPKDADFIAHASEDIPSLLAEVARLSDALAEAEKRGYDMAKEQAAKAASGQYPSQSVYDDRSPLYGADLDPDRTDFGRGKQAGRQEAATAIRAMVKP